jgi:hypothetical protein
MTAEDRKQRLRRLDQIFVRTPIYFVTTCTNSRRVILATEQFTKRMSVSLKKARITARGSART